MSCKLGSLTGNGQWARRGKESKKVQVEGQCKRTPAV